MIREHGGALYADLHRYHGIDLAAVAQGRDRRSPRLLLALIDHLPEGSAFVDSARGGAHWRGWTRDTTVLADLYDAVMADVSVNAASYSGRRRPKKSDPYPRPKKGAQQRGQSVSDVRRALGGVDRPELVAPPEHAIPRGA